MVYSENDKRWGNYIIHAFVFEKNIDLSPYGLIDYKSFKRFLTRKEWHDNPIPDDLPQMEIPETGNMLTMSEINAFFDDDRKAKLKLLIEAINSSATDNPVHFHDDQQNLIYWFKTLSLCIPKYLQNKISFCSLFTNTLVPGNISSCIQVRVGRPDGNQFSYEQEVQRGHCAFDFTRDIIPTNINISYFSDKIVNALSQGIFDVFKFNDSVNKVLLGYSVNINEAVSLISLNKADFAYFNTTDELLEAISVADRVGYEIVREEVIKKLEESLASVEIEYYYQFIVNVLIIGVSGVKQADFDEILEKSFDKILEQGDIKKIVDRFSKTIEKSKANPAPFALYLLRKYLLESENTFDKKLTDIGYLYFEKISSRDRKKLFTEMHSMAEKDEKDKVQAFIDEFNKTHKMGLLGYFAKRFV
jgi:hypothetical protein